MSGINGDYRSLAEACGEAPDTGLVFIPGEDFDPSDPNDVECVECVKLASERARYDRMTQLERENEQLRREVARVRRRRPRRGHTPRGIDWLQADG